MSSSSRTRPSFRISELIAARIAELAQALPEPPAELTDYRSWGLEFCAALDKYCLAGGALSDRLVAPHLGTRSRSFANVSRVAEEEHSAALAAQSPPSGMQQREALERRLVARLLADEIDAATMQPELDEFEPEPPLFIPSPSPTAHPSAEATPTQPRTGKRKADTSPGKDGSAAKPTAKRSCGSLKDTTEGDASEQDDPRDGKKRPPTDAQKPFPKCDYCLQNSKNAPCVPLRWRGKSVVCEKCAHARQACRWTNTPSGASKAKKGAKSDKSARSDKSDPASAKGDKPSGAGVVFGEPELLREAGTPQGTDRAVASPMPERPTTRASQRLAASTSTSSSGPSNYRERMADVTLPSRPSASSSRSQERRPTRASYVIPTIADLESHALLLWGDDLSGRRYPSADVFRIRELRIRRQRLLTEAVLVDELIRQNIAAEQAIPASLPDQDAEGEDEE
ncbi:hypothetical protein B0H21DRAFT_827412 [Amylocystis lapponica]|nr:hypothetical protein B0H21DRAFT_827412 [Amylocystis lapponica]